MLKRVIITKVCSKYYIAKYVFDGKKCKIVRNEHIKTLAKGVDYQFYCKEQTVKFGRNLLIPISEEEAFADK